MNITLPSDFIPRDYQLPLWNFYQNGGRKGVSIWHRRAGKDLNAIHLIAAKAHERVGLYWHLFPTYKQGKKIAWDGKRKDGIAFRQAFPKELIAGVNNTEMKVTFKNGSVYQVIGADDPDSLVGANPIGIVYSEWSIMSPFVRELMRPILRENDGWELYIYTPRGKNHGYKLLKMAQKNPSWHAEVLTVKDTGVVTEDMIEEDRQEGMTEEMIQQEYYCSFDTPVTGSYYGPQMSKADKEGRITAVPHEAKLQVNTAWDLGVDDSTAIWFYQQHGLEIRIIDYYETSGEGLPHYAKILKEKDYVYNRHYAPHDIEVRELSTGRTRRQIGANLGIKFTVVPRQSVEDGIEAVRSILSRCWFDEEKADLGIECLKQYHKEYDEKLQVYKNTPTHDWASHGADAFRTLAMSLREVRRNKRNLPERADDNYNPFTQYANVAAS